MNYRSIREQANMLKRVLACLMKISKSVIHGFIDFTEGIKLDLDPSHIIAR